MMKIKQENNWVSFVLGNVQNVRSDPAKCSTSATGNRSFTIFEHELRAEWSDIVSSIIGK